MADYSTVYNTAEDLAFHAREKVKDKLADSLVSEKNDGFHIYPLCGNCQFQFTFMSCHVLSCHVMLYYVESINQHAFWSEDAPFAERNKRTKPCTIMIKAPTQIKDYPELSYG
jgi:hypothetical protein